MALHLVLLPILLTAMVVSGQLPISKVVSGQDDDLPFNTTGLTPIYVHKGGSRFRATGSSCNSVTFLPRGTSSVFTSPRYPRPYPLNQRCKYVFKSLDHSCNIQIECSFFQLPQSFNCRYSTNLFTKWGFGGNEQKWCCGSNIPSTVVSSSFWAYTKFSSNWWYNWSYRGFSCTASTICPTITTAPTTAATTNTAPSTAAPTTAAQTTTAPTTVAPTTAAPTNTAPTTVAATTAAPTTVAPTTVAPTTAAPTTAAPNTVVATTAAPTTVAPTTAAPTTAAPTTVAPTTAAATTAAASTAAPTTAAPTTIAATTAAPTTAAPVT